MTEEARRPAEARAAAAAAKAKAKAGEVQGEIARLLEDAGRRADEVRRQRAQQDAMRARENGHEPPGPPSTPVDPRHAADRRRKRAGFRLGLKTFKVALPGLGAIASPVQERLQRRAGERARAAFAEPREEDPAEPD